nr:zinc finger, RING/FYVE/PHD-type [Tanacetum cinerariifolium]
MQLVVFRDNLASSNNLRTRPTQQSGRQDSELTPNEQRESVRMLKKEIYNPIPKKIIQRLGRFSRQNSAAAKASIGQKNEEKVDEDNGDDYNNKCVICLEEFEPKEVVMVTPCNHIFHEDCILPWKEERLAFLDIKRREVKCRERELEQQDMRFYLQPYDHLTGDQRKAMDEIRVKIKAKYNLQYE